MNGGAQLLVLRFLWLVVMGLIVTGCGGSSSSRHLKPLFNKAQEAIKQRDTSNLGQVIVAAQRYHTGGQVATENHGLSRDSKMCTRNEWENAKIHREYEAAN